MRTFEQLEGDAKNGASVVEFPSMELTNARCNNPAYRANHASSPTGSTIYRRLGGGRAASGTTDAAHKDAQTPKRVMAA
jgi:hypothetical protein